MNAEQEKQLLQLMDDISIQLTFVADHLSDVLPKMLAHLKSLEITLYEIHKSTE